MSSALPDEMESAPKTAKHSGMPCGQTAKGLFYIKVICCCSSYYGISMTDTFEKNKEALADETPVSGPRPIPPEQAGPGRHLKVLRLIARLNVGGPAKHVAWLMTGLDKGRFSQTLACGNVPEFEHDLGPWIREQGVDYTLLPSLGRDIDPKGDLACLFQVLGLLMKERPHILATHTSKAGFLGRSALLIYRPLAFLTGRPVPKAVHTFHGHTFHGYFSPRKTRLFLGIERFLARFATWRIVTISPRQYEEIHHTFGVGKKGQVKMVPLGIDLDPFADPAPGREAFRAELGCGPDDFLVGAVGRVAPVKNYALFLEAADELRKAGPELFRRARFLLIGGGSDEDMAGLEARRKELGLEDKVSFLGNRTDPERFFPGLDALMLTSLNEGTPVAILEGGACGLPVAASCVGGVPDLLGPEVEETPEGYSQRERGLTAPKGSARGLAAALASIMEQPELAESLGAALKDYVWASHAKERLVADIAALYEEARTG